MKKKSCDDDQTNPPRKDDRHLRLPFALIRNRVLKEESCPVSLNTLFVQSHSSIRFVLFRRCHGDEIVVQQSTFYFDFNIFQNLL